MILQVLRLTWYFVRLEIFRRSNDCEAHVFCDPNGNHLPLDELTNLDTSVVFPGHKIDWVVGGSDFKNDFRIGAGKLSQFRKKDHLRGGSRDDESNAPCRTLSLLPRLSYCQLDSFESRSQFAEKRRASGSRRNASCGSRKQLQSQALFQPSHGVAQSRLRDAQPRRRTGEAALFRYNCERRQFSQIISHDS